MVGIKQVAVLALALCAVLVSARQECVSVGIVPFAVQEPTCGWKALQVNRHVAMSRADVNDVVGEDWTELDFDDSAFSPATLPMGDNIFCGELSQYKSAATLWSKNTHLFVRRKFVLDRITYERLQNLKMAVIVDNDIISTNMNGRKFGGPYPTRDNCDGVSRVDRINVPKDKLQIGENIFALHVRDRGGQAFLNIALELRFCNEDGSELNLCSELPSAPATCRKRCDMVDQCYNSDECNPGWYSDVLGNCVCEMKQTMFCSGASPLVPDDQCYDSKWILGTTAAKIVCPYPAVRCPA